MRAITVRPGRADSAELTDVPEPPPEDGDILVDALALGICGTDGEIVRGEYGEAPEGEQRLILGHESLGRVVEAAGGFAQDDHVVGIVRRPDPVPCACCARGEWDFCRNGRYTERGIKGLQGFGSERWRIEPDFAVRVDPELGVLGVLLEPTSIVAKAWEQIERIQARACHRAEQALVTGAGPIGLLAALLGVQRGLEVHVLDQVTEGPKPELVRALGATYHSEPLAEACQAGFDVVVEATGVGPVVLDVIEHNARGAVVCLTGVSSAGRTLDIDAGALNRRIVLENDVVFGTVNAGRRHYEQAADALAAAERDWLDRLVTRRVAPEDFSDGLDRREDDVKVIVDFS